MDLLYELLKNSINIVNVETTTKPKELLARKAASVFMYYDYNGKPLKSVTVDNDAHTYEIDDTEYVYEPLPDEAILSKEAQIILMGILSDIVFSGQFNPEIVDKEVQHFYDKNNVYFDSLFDSKLYMYLQLKPCLVIFKERIKDIIDYSWLLLVDRKLVFEDAFHEEEETEIINDTKDSEKNAFYYDVFGDYMEDEVRLINVDPDECIPSIVPDHWINDSKQHQKNKNKNEG